MLIFINWMAFLGTVLKTVSTSLKELVPAFKELKDSNAKEKFWDEKKEVKP